MTLVFEKFTKRKSIDLINFLTSENWKYIDKEKLTLKQKTSKIKNKIEKGRYTKKDQATFLIKDKNKIIGYLRISDLIDEEDESPEFSVRISKSQRRNGIGSKAIDFLIEYIFTNYPKIRRIEGTTRDDNLAMQELFKKKGFRKVANYRKCWKSKDGKWRNSIGYDLLKEETKF